MAARCEGCGRGISNNLDTHTDWTQNIREVHPADSNAEIKMMW